MTLTLGRLLAGTLAAAWLALLTVAGGCQAQGTFDDNVVSDREIQVTSDVLDLAAAQDKFGWDLYRRLAESSGNLFYSPASIHTAMSMVMSGASGETRQQIADGLHVPAVDDSHFTAIAEMIHLLNRQGSGLQLRMANRLWGQDDVAFKQAFLERLGSSYAAPFGTVDFKQDAESARRAINAWVYQATQQKIEELFAKGMLDSTTRLALVNAIYFKGDWRTPFKSGDTTPSDFHLLSGQTTQIPMMHVTETFAYNDDESVQVIQLPYARGDLSMVVILPRQRDGLAAVEAQVSHEYLAGLLAGMKDRDVRLSLPKFKLNSSFVLNDTLQRLGIQRAFTEAAEFDGMTSQVPLQISVVVHKAVVAVDEQGTEAAAATGIGMRVASAPVPNEPVEFVADHPFVFALRHQPSGSLLFVGRLVEPQ